VPRRSNTHHEGTKHSVRRKAYLLIQKKIASGELAAGSLISELAISKELGSSRTPVREAAGQLLAEGLLELSPGGGLIVTQLTRQGIVDLFELREALEVFAVGRAARALTRPEDRERMENLVEETQVLLNELRTTGDKELNAEQMRRFSVSDLSFHALLIRMAANVRILRVVNDTRLMIRIFAMKRSGHKCGELERIYEQHREILQAVVAQDPGRAQKLLSEHIQASARERLEAFDQWDREASLAGFNIGEYMVFSTEP
jgi:DNA-binding GntR family transcriptional regulator